MPERSHELGREFVDKVCSFLDGTFGFHVFQTSYQASDAVSVPADAERIRFDVLLFQKRVDPTSNPPREKRVYFYCECKWRESQSDLKAELKEFLIKALKASPQLQRDYSDDFGFIFACNKPFDIDQADLQDVEHIHQFLGNTFQINDVTNLCRRTGIVFLTDWFLETTAKGRLQ